MPEFAELFRPKTVTQLIGQSQKKLAKGLLDRVDNGDIVRKLLFVGPTGCGKTTIAEMYIEKIMPGKKEVRRINCGKFRGIDDARELSDSMKFLSMEEEYKVYLFDEVHKLTTDAQGVWLTELEPIPSHCIVIACTTDTKGLLDAFIGRFSRFDIAKPQNEELKELAKGIAAAVKRDNPKGFERLKEVIESKIIDEIIVRCDGSIRQFDTYLEQVADGTYSSYVEEEIDPNSLQYKIFNQNLKLAQWFEAAKDLEKKGGYNQAAIGICNYAIAIIRNMNGNGNNGTKAKKALEIFGDGLSKNVPENVSFYAKLAKLHDNFPHQ